MKGKLSVAFLVLALGGLFVPSPAAAITFVQDAQNLDDSGATSTTIAAAWASATTTGHLVVGWCGWNDTGTANLLSVTDSQGNTYSLIGAKIRDTVFNQSHQLFFSANITGGAGSVTCTLSELQNYRRMGIAEYSGVATTTPLDGSANNLQAGAPTTTDGVTSTSITTTAAGDLIFAATQNVSEANPGGATISAGTGFTARKITGTGNGIGRMEDQVQAAAGAIAGTFTISLSKNMLTGVAAFKALVCAAVPDASYVAANAQSGQAIVYWSSANPVIILRKTAAFAGEAPTNGTSYAAGNTIGAATVVYDGATAVAGMTCAATSCTNTGLTNGTTYYYKIFAKTGSGGASCYAPGTVNTTAGVVARPASGVGAPTWSYSLAGGSILKGGTAGTGTLYATSNASRIVGLNIADGTQSWAPVATNAPIQAWLTWLPVGSGGVKSVQTGTTTMPSTGTGVPQTVNVGAAQGFAGVSDLTKSVLFFNLREQSLDPGSGQVRGQLTSTTNIAFNRANDDNQANSQTAVTIQWYVVEFKGGVFVQRGTLNTTNTSTVTLSTPVVLTKSFVLHSCSVLTANVTYDTNDYFRARLINSTTLEIVHNSAAAGDLMPCDWQVVEYSGASVQRGIGSFLSTDLSSGAIAITPVDPAKSFVQVTWRATSAPATPQTGPDFLRAQLTGGGTSVTIDRAVSGITIDYAWEVVSFTDGTTVQSGNLSFTSAQTSLTAAINVDTTRSVAFLSAYQRGGSQGYTANDDVGPGWFTTTITNATTLTVQRQVTGSVAANAAWFVVQFPQSGGSASALGVDQGTGAANTGWVYSVDPTTGMTNWQVTLTADAFQAAPAAQMQAYSSAAFKAAYTDDVLFAATLNTVGTFTTTNKVFALGASNGALLWTFSGTMDGVVGMPWVDYSRDRVYVASRAGSGGTQQSLWVIKTVDGEGVLKGQAMSCSLCSTLGHLETSPTLSYNGLTLYVGNTAGTLYAINAANLTLKWSLSLTPAGTTVTGFVWEDYVTAGRLYFAASDGTVRCIQDNGTSMSACTGWTFPSQSVAAAPLELGKLFVVAWDPAGPVGQKAQLYQINLTTGAVEKTVVVGDGEKQPGDVSTETGNEVFVGTTEGVIYKFPLTGGSL